MNKALHPTPLDTGTAVAKRAKSIGAVDVLIVGAGLSGVAAAFHLQQQCPAKSFAILERMQSFGGTWLSHNYPGIRSDSDLHTFGYRFKPWRGVPIATAEEIRRYMAEVIDDNQIDRHIFYHQEIVAASWCARARRWLVSVRDLEHDECFTLEAGFLWMCSGYYKHRSGYQPQWPGMGEFQGQMVHAEAWPEALDYSGKRVIVIGSGAAAATMIPAIAKTAKHVTMLQRSPTYFITGRNIHELVQMLRELDIPPEWIHEIARRKILKDQAHFSARCLQEPAVVREELLAGVRAQIGEHVDVDKHFAPAYRPWQQRIAFIPDGDLFAAMREQKACVVTDDIESFTPEGIRLKSGQHLQAELIVSATGFDLNVLGDIAFDVDGRALDFSQCITHLGAMFTGLPNLIWVFGYFRASWTLRADLLGDYVCRLLRHMDANRFATVVPKLREHEATMPLQPWVSADNFNPGYLKRSLHKLPKQGSHLPWLHTQDYWLDKDLLPTYDWGDG
ncbi:MAG: NAD(P)/FAD-dependent oxidoreductase, partial [Betaproteobacteria bacterium]|nr:NAD(P)/FAD-dependent oxidoreductase [Betaproteobacteria bacterium]